MESFRGLLQAIEHRAAVGQAGEIVRLIGLQPLKAGAAAVVADEGIGAGCISLFRHKINEIKHFSGISTQKNSGNSCLKGILKWRC